MDESFFPNGFFAANYYAYQYFVEFSSSPTPITPGGDSSSVGGGGRLAHKIKDKLEEKLEEMGVYSEQQDEAELFTIILSFLKTVETHNK